jgi:hypothetical protein
VNNFSHCKFLSSHFLLKILKVDLFFVCHSSQSGKRIEKCFKSFSQLTRGWARLPSASLSLSLSLFRSFFLNLLFPYATAICMCRKYILQLLQFLYSRLYVCCFSLSLSFSGVAACATHVLFLSFSVFPSLTCSAIHSCVLPNAGCSLFCPKIN